MRRALTRTLPLAFAAALSACQPRAHELCDEICRCENCSDRDYQICLIDRQEDIDTASTYGCDDQRSAVDDCNLAKYECKNSHFEYPKGTACAAEYDALTQCIDRASDKKGD